MNRRAFIGGFAALPVAAAASRLAAAQDFLPSDFRARIIALAKQRSEHPYEDPEIALPSALEDLSYDDYHQIQFRNERSFWRDGSGRFELQGMHRGFIFPERVNLFVVDDGTVAPLSYHPDLFGFGLLKELDPGEFGDIGFSGLRLLAPLKDDDPAREFLVFQGASYFRALADGLGYGLSARGLAINTGRAGGEEFPRFTDFYVERPAASSSSIRIHAVLDSPSVAGAFSFRATPGPTTTLAVEATLFPRQTLDRVGLAPLTSMFWYSGLERGEVDDFRPRVHDSDVLTMRTEDDEWLVRPLANPSLLQISSFDAGRSRGFGLAQRKRHLDDFEDLEARYHLRPSAWIEPTSNWPPGRVELVEIPTSTEFNDNIVAYWRPDASLENGHRLDYAYDLRWGPDTPSGFGILNVVQSMSGEYADNWRRFVIDFEAGAGIEDPGSFAPQVSSSSGRLEGVALINSPARNGLRLTFLLVPDSPTAELRAAIRLGNRQVSETWLYRWTKPSVR